MESNSIGESGNGEEERFANKRGRYGGKEEVEVHKVFGQKEVMEQIQRFNGSSLAVSERLPKSYVEARDAWRVRVTGWQSPLPNEKEIRSLFGNAYFVRILPGDSVLVSLRTREDFVKFTSKKVEYV